MNKFFFVLFISTSMFLHAQTQTDKLGKFLHISDSVKIETIIQSTDSKIKDKSKGEIFPWKDVFASMRAEYKEVKRLTQKHQKCHKNMYIIRFSSPTWTWEEMCGTAGYIKICINCPEQVDYESSIQN